MKILEAIEILKSRNERINRKKISHILGVSEKTIGNHWNNNFQEICEMYNNIIGYPLYLSDNKKEEFRIVPGYENYQASNLGRVIRIKNSGINFINGYITPNGYLNTKFKSRNFGIHQIIAMTFLDHIPNGWDIVVDHINGIKTDNRLENLRLVTTRENTSFGYNKKSTSSKYCGVHFRKNRNKWIAHIRINSKRIHLGHYKTEEEAHQVYQEALSKLKQPS